MDYSSARHLLDKLSVCKLFKVSHNTGTTSIFMPSICAVDADVPLRVCDAEVDSVWGVKWIETLAGSMDFQPCPSDSNSGTINGIQSINCLFLLLSIKV